MQIKVQIDDNPIITVDADRIEGRRELALQFTTTGGETKTIYIKDGRWDKLGGFEIEPHQINYAERTIFHGIGDDEVSR